MTVNIRKAIPFLIGFLLVAVAVAKQVDASVVKASDLYGVEVVGNKYWVCGANGEILHSSDGKSWVKQKTGVDVSLVSITFVNEKKGFCVGFSGTLLKTDDGGNRWVKIPVDTKYCITGIYFINESKGFITGEFGKLMTTDDGGEHWTSVFKQEMDSIFQAIDFCEGKYGWVVGEFGNVYRSDDAGRTWKKIDVGAEEYTLFSVKAIDKNRVVVTSMDGLLFITVNGGKTWKKTVVTELQAQLFGVEPVSKDEIYIYGMGGLIKTSYDFKSFQNIPLGEGLVYGWIYRIRKNTGVGKDGSIYKLDAGKWRKENVSYNN